MQNKTIQWTKINGKSIWFFDTDDIVWTYFESEMCTFIFKWTANKKEFKLLYSWNVMWKNDRRPLSAAQQLWNSFVKCAVVNVDENAQFFFRSAWCVRMKHVFSMKIQRLYYMCLLYFLQHWVFVKRTVRDSARVKRIPVSSMELPYIADYYLEFLCSVDALSMVSEFDCSDLINLLHFVDQTLFTGSKRRNPFQLIEWFKLMDYLLCS